MSFEEAEAANLDPRNPFLLKDEEFKSSKVKMSRIEAQLRFAELERSNNIKDPTIKSQFEEDEVKEKKKPNKIKNANKQNAKFQKPIAPDMLIEASKVATTFKSISYKEIPNYKKKLCCTNLPPQIRDQELSDFFSTFLTTLGNKRKAGLVLSVKHYRKGAYTIIELNSNADCQTCLQLDGTDWQGYKMKVQFVKRFFEDYNALEGKNCIRNRKKSKKNKSQSNKSKTDSKLYMGGIPATMDENKARSICESFGMLKSFNLVRDVHNPTEHKGFAFLEYMDDKVIERAIKALSGFEVGDKRLRVQRASTNQKIAQAPALPATPTAFFNNVPDGKRVKSPMWAIQPSTVLMLLNMVSPEDLLEEGDYEFVKEDIFNACNKFGEVIQICIPRPDVITGALTSDVGKIFVKFGHNIASKQARFHLSGRKYGGRTVVTCFYPEINFDMGDLTATK